jgi:hypothetical protein
LNDEGETFVEIRREGLAQWFGLDKVRVGMSAKVELQLAYRGAGLRLVQTRFCAEGESSQGWISQLFDREETRRRNVRRPWHELLPPWGNPQRALVVFMLRAFAEEGIGFVLESRESSLAPPLFAAIRQRETPKGQATWLQRVFGLGQAKDVAKRSQWLNNWLDAEGSGSGPCRIRAGHMLRGACLKVFLDGKELPRWQYKERVVEIEEQTLRRSQIAGLMSSVNLLVWVEDKRQYLPMVGPVREGDLIKIKVHSKEPAHVLVAWIDQSGRPHSIYPWGNTKWALGNQLEPTTAFAIPNVPDDTPGNLAVGGPAGLETVLVMAQREKPTAESLGQLPGLLKMRHTRGWHWMLKAPVIARLSNKPKTPQSVVHTRTPSIAKTPLQVEQLHQSLAKRLADKFDDIWACTFANLGPRRRLR